MTASCALGKGYYEIQINWRSVNRYKSVAVNLLKTLINVEIQTFIFELFWPSKPR